VAHHLGDLPARRGHALICLLRLTTGVSIPGSGAAARRAGTGRRPHAPRERLRLHGHRAWRGAVRRRLEQVWKV